jgi:NOL1/NOP2/sun family putative RNA methylase
LQSFRFALHDYDFNFGVDFLDLQSVSLPQEFIHRMKEMLGKEFESFLEYYEKPYYRGIRLNTLKCTEQSLKEALPFPINPAPFSPLSYYIPADAEKIGSLPMHHAGAFYSQEPSAASAVTVLDPKPGDIVLDLCAAPGGKSTQIASLLGGEGLLWSNEVVRSRASILLSNLERCGVPNAVVSCCHPEQLCTNLAGYFDKALVDAPCSGEGMFRRDQKAVEDWSPEHVQACAVRQLAILESAANALKENGIMVYSTCTFSPEENEGVIRSFLERHSDFELVDCGQSFGRPALLEKARRIYPMDGGEGHFVARMRRLSPNPCHPQPYSPKKQSQPDGALDLYRQIFKSEPKRSIEQIGTHYLLLPEVLPELSNLGVIRAGVLLGEAKRNRAEPEHAIFMASRPEELNLTVNLAHDSEQIMSFLRGEEIEVDPGCKGYAGVAVNGILTGFGKCSNGRLKNHYPKGLRNH